MGAWGDNSWECDDVQDELDQHWNMKAPGPHRQAAGVHAIVSKMKPDAYNPTVRVGVVVALLDTDDLEVGKETLELAIADAQKALADKKYLKSWKSPAKREKALQAEVKLLQKALS